MDGCKLSREPRSHCLSVRAADREREAELEASAGGGDRERPAVVRQSTTRPGGLAEPRTHLPTLSNTVGPLHVCRHHKQLQGVGTIKY